MVVRGVNGAHSKHFYVEPLRHSPRLDGRRHTSTTEVSRGIETYESPTRRTTGMLSHAYRNKNVGWVAGTALLAIVVGGVTGCSKDSDSDSGVKAKPAARSSSAADATKGKESVDSATSQPSSGRQ